MEPRKELYSLLSKLLEYPTTDLWATASRCRDLIKDVDPKAGQLVADIASYVETTPLGTLEELYTATFDVNPVCSPYVGYQLLGDDPKRSTLLVKMQEEYRAAGVDTGKELPDHLAMVFQFLATQEDPAVEEEIVETALLPTLTKMKDSLSENNPYGSLIRAALATLGGTIRA